jgi:hypothetical protein
MIPARVCNVNDNTRTTFSNKSTTGMLMYIIPSCTRVYYAFTYFLGYVLRPYVCHSPKRNVTPGKGRIFPGDVRVLCNYQT